MRAWRAPRRPGGLPARSYSVLRAFGAPRVPPRDSTVIVNTPSCRSTENVASNSVRLSQTLIGLPPQADARPSCSRGITSDRT